MWLPIPVLVGLQLAFPAQHHLPPSLYHRMVLAHPDHHDGGCGPLRVSIGEGPTPTVSHQPRASMHVYACSRMPSDHETMLSLHDETASELAGCCRRRRAGSAAPIPICISPCVCLLVVSCPTRAVPQSPVGAAACSHACSASSGPPLSVSLCLWAVGSGLALSTSACLCCL